MSQFSPSMLNVLNGLLVGQGLQISPTLTAAIAAYRALPTAMKASQANGLKSKVTGTSLTNWDSTMSTAPALVDYLPTQTRTIKGWGSDPLTFDDAGVLTYLDINDITLTNTGLTYLIEQWASVLTFGGKVKKLCSLILAMNGHMTQLNEVLASTANSQSAGKTVLFRGADFQATGGISAVSSDLTAFSIDLSKLGKVINFARIGELGDPALLLETLSNQAGGLTRGLVAALSLAGMTPEQISGIGTNITFDNQTKAQMYRGMSLITDTELDVVKAIFRTTVSIETMADLLDLKKIFPTSYQTLLAITDDLIYTSGAISPELTNTPTGGMEFVTSKEITISNKRFRESLLQVAGIKDQTAPTLSTVIDGLALNTGLPAVNALTEPLPDDTNVLAALGQGTGEQGLYRFRDMIGTITGLIHDPILTEVTGQVAGTNTAAVLTQLTRLYDMLAMTAIYDSSDSVSDGLHTDEVGPTPGPASPPTISWVVFEGITYASVPFGGNPWNDPTDAILSDLLPTMTAWVSANPAIAASSATLMTQAAAQVDREIFARNAYEDEVNFALAATRETRATLTSFVVALHRFGQDPDLMETVEKITDSSLTGQSITATMREGKNLKALAATGITTDLIVPSTL